MLFAILISIIFLNVFVLLLIFIKRLKKKIDNYTPTQIPTYRTLAERLQDYVLEFVNDANIPLENILIHNKDNSGSCIIAYKEQKLKKHGKYSYSNDLKENTEYLYVPEIKDYHQAYIWLHEIAHYIFRHNHENDSADLTRLEFEADMYAINMLDKFPIPPKLEYYSKDFERNIHNINLVMIKNLAQQNVKLYYDKLDFETKYLYTFAEHNRDIIHFLGTEFEYKEN